jgi:hypothetical protein
MKVVIETKNFSESKIAYEVLRKIDSPLLGFFNFDSKSNPCVSILKNMEREGVK